MRFTAITSESNSNTLGQLSYTDGSTFNVRLHKQTDGTKRLAIQQSGGHIKPIEYYNDVIAEWHQYNQFWLKRYKTNAYTLIRAKTKLPEPTPAEAPNDDIEIIRECLAAHSAFLDLVGDDSNATFTFNADAIRIDNNRDASGRHPYLHIPLNDSDNRTLVMRRLNMLLQAINHSEIRYPSGGRLFNKPNLNGRQYIQTLNLDSAKHCRRFQTLFGGIIRTAHTTDASKQHEAIEALLKPGFLCGKARWNSTWGSRFIQSTEFKQLTNELSHAVNSTGVGEEKASAPTLR